ncbi:MAG: hypothetical protein PVF17_13125, partial [Ignavibacteria bacterium]
QILLLLFYVTSYSFGINQIILPEDSLKLDSTISLTVIDSLSVSDSLKSGTTLIVRDTLVPIQEEPISNVGNIINKRSFLFENYRYSGDHLRLFPLNFVRDLAFIGYPNESFIYGAGFGGISYLEDGLLRNDRYKNILDLNHLQSEDIDSIEVIPSPRGFLFGPYNNPVAVNFIMKDFISAEPYSRIRYYEGPEGEGMIDGMFNARIYKRWNLSFQVTNRAADDNYINTDLSLWQINAKLKYFLSNRINIIASYRSVDEEIGLNGGVDVDSIAKLTADINSILYNNTDAFVNYPGRIQKILNHHFRLKAKTLPWENARMDVALFYKYSDNEISNELDTIVLKDGYDNKNFGVVLNFNQRYDILSLQLLSTYENNKTFQYAGGLSNEDLSINHNYFSVSSIISLNLLGGRLIPSFFYKYSRQSLDENSEENPTNSSGIGFDLYYKPFDCFSLYSGYSVYNQLVDEKVKTFEAGIRIKNETLLSDIKYFSRNNFIPSYIRSPFILDDDYFEPQSIKGLGIVFNYKIWKILIETNTSYYFDQNGYAIFSLPEIRFQGGLYLNDIFFDESLLLKTGIKFYYKGKITAYAENSGYVNVEPSKRIDFTLAGEIKKVAIVYFIWENLLDEKYFIQPYYPMPERSIRFGLSWELLN